MSVTSPQRMHLFSFSFSLALALPVVLALALALVVAAPGGAQESESESRPMTIDDVLGLRSVGDPRVSPDGTRVAYVVAARNFDENVIDSDVWLVSTSTSGEEPLRLTNHLGRDDEPRWEPNGEWIAYVSDREGEPQVYGIRPDGGEAWRVTDWPNGIESFRLSPDGARIAFVAKPETSEAQEAAEKERGRPIVWDEAYDDEWSRLWVAPLEERRAKQAVRMSPDHLHVGPIVWAPDGRRIAFGARPAPALRTNRLANVYVVEVAEGAGDVVDARQVTSLPGSEAPEAWSESHGLIVSGTGHLLGTFNREMYRVPLDGGGGDPVSLTESLDENAIFVHIGREVLLVQALHRTGRALYAIELSSGALTRLTDERLYRQWFTASKDGSVVAYIADAWNEPTNVYAARVVEGGSGEARGVSSERRLTDVDSHVRGLLLGEQKVVRWASRADGEEIEGVLTLPVGYEEGSERVPLLLVIHGGPSGVSSDRYSPHRGAYPIQVFAGMGYAVLQPNYRGSTGYGERFRGLNRGDISGRDWIDIDSGVDAQIDAGLADPERLGIMGWSFGGHHTYWGITQTNRFRAASAGAGANDLISMYSQTDLPEFYHTYLGPKPWEDFELYEERSAYRFVERVVTPLLIQVGERDERVPAEQSVQFYEAAKAIGKAETQLVVYPGQPHGVREPRLFRDLLERNLDWFERLVPAGRSESRGSH